MTLSEYDVEQALQQWGRDGRSAYANHGHAPIPSVFPLKRWSRSVAVTASVVAVLLATLAVTYVAGGPDRGRSSSASPATAALSAASTNPATGSTATHLLARLPAPTAPVRVADGTADNGARWTLWVTNIPLTSQPRSVLLPNGLLRNGRFSLPLLWTVRPGLCGSVIYQATDGPGGAGGGGTRLCGDPRTLPPLVVSGSQNKIAPNVAHSGRLLTGATTADAATLTIRYKGKQAPTTTKTVAMPSLPGLTFFATNVPSWNIASISALDAAGHALHTIQQPRLSG